MKVDDLLSVDQAQSTPGLDPTYIAALNAHGFVNVSYSLFHKPGHPPSYVGLITGIKRDLTSHVWTGEGATPEEAEVNTIDALAKWILGQAMSYYPTPGATP